MLPEIITVDGVEYRRGPIATRVSAFVMYDCHLFRELKGCSISELLEDWERECAHPDERYGEPMLCPVIVLGEKDKELRRVGEMLFPATTYAPRSEVGKWRGPVEADPDISRILAMRR